MVKTSSFKFGVAAIAFGLTPAFGGITYQTQSRSVVVSATEEGDSASAPDFSLFQAQRSASSMYGTGASAGQYSELETEGMFVSGGASAHGGMQFFGASARSTFDVTFVIDEPRPFRFWGGLFQGDGFRPADCSVSLTGPGGLIYSSSTGGSWNINDLAQPGLYQLAISVSVSAAGGPRSSSGSIYSGFVIPSPDSPLWLMAIGIATSRRRR